MAERSGVDWTRMALYTAAGVAAIILGISLSLLIFGPPQADRAAVGRPILGGPFSLVDQDGAPQTEAILKGRTSLLYFGYTYCPDFCPTELANLAVAAERLEARGVETQIVFISVDPERDTPEILKQYISYFGENIVGLTGEEAMVAAAAKAYGAFYQRLDNPEQPKDYLISHTTLVYAVDPEGRFFQSFAYATDPAEIEAKVAARVGPSS